MDVGLNSKEPSVTNASKIPKQSAVLDNLTRRLLRLYSFGELVVVSLEEPSLLWSSIGTWSLSKSGSRLTLLTNLVSILIETTRTKPSRRHLDELH